MKTFDGDRLTLAPGETGVLKASERVGGLNFWSWGYGYLYDVDTELVDDKGRSIDKVTTRTGFRKDTFWRGQDMAQRPLDTDTRLCPAHLQRVAGRRALRAGVAQ